MSLRTFSNLMLLASISGVGFGLSACETQVSLIPTGAATPPSINSPDGAAMAGEHSTSGGASGSHSGAVPIAGQPDANNPSGGGNGLIRVTDSFNVINKSKPVDVLFVMDNSGSMAEEQQRVVDSFATFLGGFTAEIVDYHIGVIATDSKTDPNWWSQGTSQTPSPYENFPNFGMGSLLARSGNERFISTQTSNAAVIEQFRENALLGIQGGVAEAGLLATTTALSAALNTGSGWNTGFLRADSLLEVIIVSDEDESVGDVDTQYIKNVSASDEAARINDFSNRLKEVRPNRPDLTRVDFVISPVDQTCTSAAQKGDTYTKAYNQLYPVANPNNGKIMNICKNFSGELGALGSQIATQVERRFKTSKQVAGDLIVKLDGVEIPLSSTQGYTFNASSTEITIHGLNLEQKSTFAVTLVYASR